MPRIWISAVLWDASKFMLVLTIYRPIPPPSKLSSLESDSEVVHYGAVVLVAFSNSSPNALRTFGHEGTVLDDFKWVLFAQSSGGRLK